MIILIISLKISNLKYLITLNLLCCPCTDKLITFSCWTNFDVKQSYDIFQQLTSMKLITDYWWP